MDRTVLVLGGTAEARRLASGLVGEPGVHVVTSLAGRVRQPLLPEGEVRVGGFGGPDALAAWLGEHGVVAVVDATHPFAARISANAAAATAAAGVPLVVLRRPGWVPEPGWTVVGSLDAAAAALPGLGERVFLTTGRGGLAAFADSDLWFLVRSIDAPTPPAPRRMETVLARGPFTVADERDLLRAHAIDVLVTKDSGGPAAKLEAARAEGVPVLVVARPPVPAEVEVVETVAGARSWVRDTVARCAPSTSSASARAIPST
ncbi:cobalt-precorrin-6A reductase [Pseudonocardia petroleophila]|uniref:cobalt-precorrin-6A reductase n=1 Tax=Pseudonocardia petroleophila TaxID=37331 RepID=UPI002108457F|nr:cobalt-precorrin-6A reductase [Pseudonocardia petroleophila]